MISLSVILPAKDVAPYIGAALTSLLRNHRADFEYVVVDDGSSDATPDIVDDFRRRLPNLRMLHNPSPTGLSAARNRALAATRGRYVTYLDGDDWLAPGYLARAVDAVSGLGVDFVKTDQVWVFGSRRVANPVPEGRVYRPLDPRSGILPTNGKSVVDHPNACTGVYSRKLAEQGLLTFDTSLLTCEDRPWAWRLHLGAASYARVPVVGVYYRREVPGSLTGLGDERQLHFFDACDRIISLVTADREADRFLPKAVRSYCSLILHHLDHRGRLAPALRGHLVDRAVGTLRGLPPAVLDTTIREMGGDGERRLRTLHDTASLGEPS